MLRDVHLRLLHLVVKSWSRRAAKQLQASPKKKAPTLTFQAQIGEGALGEVALCTVDEGPALNWLERFLVRNSFVYGPAIALSPSTRKMLDELVDGVEAAAEQHRFGAAHEGLREVFRLHKTLLLAGASDVEAIGGNAATIGHSPSSWGNSTINQEWLKPYRDVARIAVNRLEEDERLFHTLSNITASIANQLQSRPEQLLIDAQLVSANLSYQLSAWWTRKADASLAPGATSFNGVLPAHEHKIYERALVGFIGGWSQFRVRVGGDTDDNAGAWHRHTGRAIAYAAHIDNTARLYLQSVSRGDEAASVWLLDCFLKWSGNREFELECPEYLEDFRLRNVTLKLSQRNWNSAQQYMWDGTEPITLEFAVQALNLAVRKYWESIRLYVILLLIQNAGPTPSSDSRELRHAAALISGEAQRDGGSVEVWPLSSLDDVLRATLGIVYGVETSLARIDAFAESLDWRGAGHVVPGWIYSWSGSAHHLESMKRPLGVLLVALSGARRNGTTQSQKLIEQWWRDLDKLQEVKTFCAEVRQDVRSEDFDSFRDVVEGLQAHLGLSHRVRFGRLAVATALGGLQRVARHEHRTSLAALEVDKAKVQALAGTIASVAFDTLSFSLPVNELSYVSMLAAPELRYRFVDSKKYYTRGYDSDPDRDLAKHVGKHVRDALLRLSFHRLVCSHGLNPVNGKELRTWHEVSHEEMQAYVSEVTAQCSTHEANGDTPVILAGHSPAGALLSAYRWGPAPWRCPPPVGVTVEQAHAHDGPHAVSRINGVAVYEAATPDGDCFVVPRRLLKALAVVGSKPESALSIAWRELNEDQLEFTVSCRADLVSTQGP